MRKCFGLPITALVLAISVLFSACALPEYSLEDALSAIYDEILPEPGYGRHTVVPFDEMKYERPDLESIREKVSTAMDMAEDPAKILVITDQLAECDAAYYTFYTMYTLSEICYYRDMTDAYWAEEYEFCSLATTDVELMFDELYIACANSEMAQRLEENYFGEGFIDYYGGDYTGLTDETYEELVRREEELLNRYRELQADPTLEYCGKTVSYYEMMADPGLPDKTYADLQDLYYEIYNPILGELYIELVQVRKEIAAYMGYDSYEAYAFENVYYRDYTPEDAHKLIDEIKTHIAPLCKKMYNSGIWWELVYWVSNEKTLERQISSAAKEMGGEIGTVWDFMEAYDLYDITISPNKVDMSYQSYLEDYEAPFAFIKTYGSSEDILTFAHEFGHCVDAYVNYNDTYSLELAETFSLGMEYLLLFYPGTALSEDEVEELKKAKLVDTVTTHAQQASFAEFERQVYSLPEEELTVERINEISLQTAGDFGYLQSGDEDYYAASWIDIVHFFEYPCYVISYCVSGDAAFQIYQAELEEPGKGLELYNAILPREYENFLETLENQGQMESPFAEGRMESTARLLRDYFGY